MRAVLQQTYRAWPSALACSCLLLATAAGCTVDAVVYRAALDSPDAGSADAGTPRAGAPAVDAGVRVFGCRAESGGGLAILTEILTRLNEDFLTIEKPPCSTDADCVQTFVTPACDERTQACVPCPGAAQQAAFGVRLGTCLPAAAARCCRDPEASSDCIVKACTIGCDS